MKNENDILTDVFLRGQMFETFWVTVTNFWFPKPTTVWNYKNTNMKKSQNEFEIYLIPNYIFLQIQQISSKWVE